MPLEFILMDKFEKLVCRKASNAEFIQTKEEEKHVGQKGLDVVFYQTKKQSQNTIICQWLQEMDKFVCIFFFFFCC